MLRLSMPELPIGKKLGGRNVQERTCRLGRVRHARAAIPVPIPSISVAQAPAATLPARIMPPSYIPVTVPQSDGLGRMLSAMAS